MSTKSVNVFVYNVRQKVGYPHKIFAVSSAIA